MLIKRFEDIQETDLPLIGSKGLNLGLKIENFYSSPQDIECAEAQRRTDQSRKTSTDDFY